MIKASALASNTATVQSSRPVQIIDPRILCAPILSPGEVRARTERFRYDFI
jgi:hypothetical protein